VADLGEESRGNGDAATFAGREPGAEVLAQGPDTWKLDAAGLARPGSDEMQLDLFHDYRTKVALYPRFHAFFVERRRPP
jgi:hypothetical protein